MSQATMPAIRWKISAKGNLTATWCGQRVIVYPDKRKPDHYRVMFTRDESPPDFVDASWTDEDAAKTWAETALLAKSDPDATAPPLPNSPNAYRPWNLQRIVAVPPWAATLGLQAPYTLEAAKLKHRQLAMEHHPDRGGLPEQMIKINDAWAAARVALTETKV